MVKVVDSLHVNLQPEAGRMPYQKEKGHFSTQSVNCSGHVANIASQKKIEKPWIFCKETGWPCKQEAESFDEKLWKMTPIRAAFVCSKACDIVAEDASSVASQHSASCFFDRQAICDRNSKGGIRGFPNWDWKISKQSLSISEHCKKTAHDTKWPCLFWTFLEFIAFLVIMTSSASLSCVQGTDMWNPNLFPVRSPRLLIHPLNWKSPHHARKCGAASWNL